MSAKRHDGEEVIQLQAKTSQGTVKASNSTEHLTHQQKVFDEISDWFADRRKEVPPELEPVYEEMATDLLNQLLMTKRNRRRRTNDGNNDHAEIIEAPFHCHILDVACGTGVLWEFLMEAAEKQGVLLNITGVDLSPNMVRFAKQRVEHLLLSGNETTSTASSVTPSQHSIEVFCSDVIEFCKSSENLDGVDGCILNACFGNFWNRRAVLEALPGQTICISHPLGASFVQELHDKDPKTVPHTLPETMSELSELTEGLGWVLQESTTITDKSDSNNEQQHEPRPYYLTALSRAEDEKINEPAQDR